MADEDDEGQQHPDLVEIAGVPQNVIANDVPVRIIGADLAARHPDQFKNSARDALYARDPCPICGHATGDCV